MEFIGSNSNDWTLDKVFSESDNAKHEEEETYHIARAIVQSW